MRDASQISPEKASKLGPWSPPLPTVPATVHSGGSHRGFQISFTEFLYLKGDRNDKLGATCASIVLLLNLSGPGRGCDTFQLLPGLQFVQWHAAHPYRPLNCPPPPPPRTFAACQLPGCECGPMRATFGPAAKRVTHEVP